MSKTYLAVLRVEVPEELAREARELSAEDRAEAFSNYLNQLTYARRARNVHKLIYIPWPEESVAQAPP